MVQYMTIPEAAVLWETNPTAIRVGCGTSNRRRGSVWAQLADSGDYTKAGVSDMPGCKTGSEKSLG